MFSELLLLLKKQFLEKVDFVDLLKLCQNDSEKAENWFFRLVTDLGWFHRKRCHRKKQFVKCCQFCSFFGAREISIRDAKNFYQNKRTHYISQFAWH